ncbi:MULTISPECIES: ABC transporter permease [Streptomyces]|uniref:Transport permease protein n=2 Tax=Streptomyces TaxID=1883 RepID=A0A124ECE7_9ACTN|nr:MULTISPECIES: ABC transporter permease [Streptomyces]KUH37371.1 ABC transporter [Streptomyces kanasensis]UUS31621.1 ABC transporter permease [Streptomyces changanensis]
MSTTTSGGAPAREDDLAPVPARTLAELLVAEERPTRAGPLAASLAFGWRAMLKIKHVPEQLFDVTVLPVMMVLMFTHLFGGALAGSPREYIQYLLPGVMVMSVVMTTMYTGIAINNDIDKGVFDRFRTLPIWRPATIIGYLLGDVLRYSIASLVMLTAGMIIGFRPDGGVPGVVAGILLLIVFAFAFSWIGTMFGLLVRDEKTVMGASMTAIFPLNFLSDIFVDPATMPGWLQTLVHNNPITHVASAVRGLMDGRWPGVDIAWTLGWSVALVAVFGSLTVRLYNRK